MTAHAVYLAIIAILIIIIVYAAARAVRAARVMREVSERFGLHEIFRASVPRSAPLRRVTIRELLKPRSYDEYLREIDALISRAVSLGEFGKRTKLSEACEHALKGGKRLRPIILMEIARAVNVRRWGDALKHSDREAMMPVDPADAALFVEYMHSASLIVDDMPAFDNDAERRGKPSVHALMSPAVAQMAAISLVSSAFQNICRQIDWIRDNCPEFKEVDNIGTKLCNDISQAIGVFGAAGGQYMDVSSADQLFAEYGPGAVMEIMYKKTATFFEIAAVTGWLIAGGEARSLEDVRSIGKHLGIAFQIADDIGDMDRDAERRKKGKPGFNIAHEIGKDEAVREMNRNLHAARLNLERLHLWSDLWDTIEKKVVCMTASQPDPPRTKGPLSSGGDQPAEADSDVNPAKQKSSPRNPTSTGVGVTDGTDGDTSQALWISGAASVAPVDAGCIDTPPGDGLDGLVEAATLA
jgi:geranylgeranyl diphosphate synthase, type II